ncbi:hypothetical protein VTN00DRAFT_4716 [Thermoascus crustaceus]|uniref:uncharacterized protein n=1 Tax=Thermoascus crustaceus TaxID=5088 RepID=UPI003742A37F
MIRHSAILQHLHILSPSTSPSSIACPPSSFHPPSGVSHLLRGAPAAREELSTSWKDSTGAGNRSRLHSVVFIYILSCVHQNSSQSTSQLPPRPTLCTIQHQHLSTAPPCPSRSASYHSFPLAAPSAQAPGPPHTTSSPPRRLCLSTSITLLHCPRTASQVLQSTRIPSPIDRQHQQVFLGNSWCT